MVPLNLTCLHCLQQFSSNISLLLIVYYNCDKYCIGNIFDLESKI